MLKPIVLAATALAWIVATPQAASAQPASTEYARFAPVPSAVETRLDWTLWDEALDYFVYYMGPSLRESAPRRQPSVGTRLVYGHDSRYRMEANRVAYELIEDDKIATLTEYRLDLQRIGSEIDIASLPRNEQLAFWMNLHNVATIEQIGLAYPVSQPRDIRLDGVRLDEAKFIVVDGIAMSLRDIRTKIVYPNWQDPRVIYGFFRGDIGGPSIQETAFTGANVATLLDTSADEFVNSLRGLQTRGSELQVSEIYEEARSFFFADWPGTLTRHLARYAKNDLASSVAAARSIKANIYEYDIADLSKGEREPLYASTDECPAEPGYGGFQAPGSCPRPNYPPIAIQRFVEQRADKVEKLVERGLYGRVTVIVDNENAEEVD